MISHNDEAAIGQLGDRWEAAWNAHDMRALAALVSPDVDFITVKGGWLGDREIFQTYHSARHAAQFLTSIWRTQGMTVRPLTPDICAAHVNWRITGDCDPDGTPRPSREGIFTWIVRRGEAGWLIDCAHNTDIDVRVVGPAYRKPAAPRTDIAGHAP